MEFTDLVLLIGTNPLPNFVVADYFASHNNSLKRIWLVHSESNEQNREGTLHFAKNLTTLIQERHDKELNFNYVPLSNISRARQIRSDIEVYLIQEMPQDASIHLNYTGGTKVMGIHAYLALENSFAEQTTYSYLDGRNYRLIDDEDSVIHDNLREEVKIKFEKLIELHGFERKGSGSEIDCEGPVKAFETLIENEDLQKYWSKEGGYIRDFFTRVDRPYQLVSSKNQITDREGNLRGPLQGYRPNEHFRSVLDALPHPLFDFDEDGRIVGLHEDITTDKLSRAVRFLDGVWLEDWVYCCLKEIELEEMDLEANWHIKKPDWSSKNKFELDVLLVKGYQLFAISCTTSADRYIVKSKAFEVMYRARQIGGDEVKVLVISTLKRPRDLQREMELDTGGAGNLKIFGIHNLRRNTLVTDIKQILNN